MSFCQSLFICPSQRLSPVAHLVLASAFSPPPVHSSQISVNVTEGGRIKLKDARKKDDREEEKVTSVTFPQRKGSWEIHTPAHINTHTHRPQSCMYNLGQHTSPYVQLYALLLTLLLLIVSLAVAFPRHSLCLLHPSCSCLPFLSRFLSLTLLLTLPHSPSHS